MKRSLIVFSILLASAGCKEAPAEHVHAAAPVQLAGGWHLIENKEDGISVAAPGGWKYGSGYALDAMTMVTQGADPSGNSELERLAAGMEAQSQAEEAKEMARLREKGIITQVIDSGSRAIVGEERTRFLLKRIKHDSNYSLEEASLDEQDFLKGEGPAQKVTLPIGPAVRYDAEVETRGGDKVNRISYCLVDGKNAYFLRFIATNNPDAIKAIATQVAESLRIEPSK